MIKLDENYENEKNLWDIVYSDEVSDIVQTIFDEEEDNMSSAISRQGWRDLFYDRSSDYCVWEYERSIEDILDMIGEDIIEKYSLTEEEVDTDFDISSSEYKKLHTLVLDYINTPSEWSHYYNEFIFKIDEDYDNWTYSVVDAYKKDCYYD